MRKLTAAAALVFLVQTGAVFAAGPFDGAWSGEAAGSGAYARACAGTIKGTVADNVFHGTITIGRFNPVEFGGTVGADGSFKTPAGRITGQFTGSSFVGAMTVQNGSCNPYRLTMSRS